MTVLQQVLSLLLTLGILVTVHEFGHFWVARRCGVKVLRFSVGFGTPIFKKIGRTGTEYVIAAIPLGGYVKMLDEREGPVPEEERHLAFNVQPVERRIAIAAAGPLFNFLFAILAYLTMYTIGFHVVAPVVGDVEPGSPAHEAGLRSGLEVIELDGEVMNSWQSVTLALADHLGETHRFELKARPFGSDDPPSTYLIDVERWMVGEDEPMPLDGLGIKPYRPHLEPVIGAVTPNLPGDKAGLKPGDRILSVEGRSISSWQALVDQIQVSAGKPLHMKVLRGSEETAIEVTPETRVLEDGRTVGFLGVAVKPASWPEGFIRTVSYGPGQALIAGISRTWDDIALTFGAIKKLIEGLISVKSLSGPITIAKMAEQSVSFGFESFLRFLAYLSVSLGVLNLLPIPVLDGGHLLYYTIELIARRPLPEKVQVLGLKIGVALILALMIIAFYNDLSRI